jgi:hypothetical protein
MQMILKREWEAIDASDRAKHVIANIPAGTHEMERIPNPFFKNNTFWLVLKGTMIGASEGSWRQWINDGSLVTNPDNPNFGKPIDWGEDEIVIRDDASPSPQSDLRDFLKRSMDQSIVEVIDRPLDYPNQIESFVLYTNGPISGQLLLIMLQRYYLDATIAVRAEELHWVKRPGKITLLLAIKNFSEVGGATFWGGPKEHGGIGVEISEHPKA